MLLAALLCLSTTLPAKAQQPLPPVLGTSNLPLLPYLDAFIDTSDSMDIDEVAAPENASRFAPLNLRALPRVGGATWLRIVIAPMPEGGKADKILLDMGDDIPGSPTFYTASVNPLSNTLEWQENDRSRVQLLPEAGLEAQTCYIRLDGLPGFWFSPTLRTPQDATTNWGGLAHTGATLALGVVMLLCLLRGFTEKGQWRIWTSLYVAVALAQSILGMPVIADGRIPMNEAAAALAPGVALMLLPHVARHFMDTRRASRALDAQYLLLTLPGVALALVPLLPDFSWLTRYLPLWPAATILFVPTTLGACLMGLGGGARFLLACLLQTLAVGAAFAGMDFGYPSAVLASLPYWGTALGALLIAGTASPRRKRTPEEDDTTGIPVAPPDDDFLSLDMPGAEKPAAKDEEDSSLIINIADFESPAATEKQPAPAAPAAPAAPPMPAPAAPAATANGKSFNLQQLLREAHDAVAADAERKNIGLSWYMPPNLGQLYEGDSSALSTVLRTLLNSSVRATSRGAVQFSARRVRESNEPGHLLFNVNDTGSGMPPNGRSSTALARAADLAGMHGGFFEAECGPQGASVSFSLHFRPVEDEADSPVAAAPRPVIMIVAPNVAARNSIAEALNGMPCTLRQANSLGGATSLNTQRPAAVLIVCGQEATPSSRGLVERFRNAAASLPHFGAIAVTDDDRLWDMLADAGFTHALLAPPAPAALRATVEEILSGKLDEDIAELPAAAPAPTPAPRGKGVPDLFGAPASSRPLPTPPAAGKKAVPPAPRPAAKPAPTGEKPTQPAADLHDEAAHLVAAEDARLQSRLASQASPAKPAPAPAAKAAPQPAAPRPAPVSQTPASPAPARSAQPRPAASAPTQDSLDDLPDFVRSEEPEESVVLPSSRIAGPWVTSDGEASPALKDAWKQPTRAAAPQRRPSVPFTPTPRPAGSVSDVEVGDPMPIPRPRAQATPTVARTRPANGQRTSRDVPPPPPRREEGMPSPDPNYSEARAAMLRRVDALLQETQAAYNEGRPQHAAMTALDIAREMDAFGIRHIARLARNVERAGTAGDMEALGDILPELYNAMERLYIQLDRR